MRLATSHRSPARRPLLLLAAGGAIAVIVFVLWYFQPQKLFIDETVNEASPLTQVAPEPAASPPSTTAAGSEALADADTQAMTDSAAMTDTTEMTDGTAMTDGSAMPDGTAMTATTPTAPPAPVLIAQGAFTSLEHATSGTAQLITQPDGRQILRLEELDTSNGPDLHVLLTPAAADAGDDAYETGALELGSLKGNKGSQNYELPPGTDTTGFRSVIIWCDRFSAAFGAAALEPVA